MKPIRLEIEGLQSFSKKQIVDFQELTSLGLFGIFGETGSGKSTILDAMILAIYGVIPRTMGRKDNGIRPCLNYESDKISVYFKFLLGEREFQITREYKKKYNKKGEEKFDTINPLLLINNEVVGDTVKNVDSILNDNFGINVEDFTRSVVLPQGKFSEFLRLKSADRINMLENIFDLEKYGSELHERLKIKLDNIKNKITALENQIKGKGDISISLLEEYISEKNDKEIKFEILKKERDKIIKEENELLRLKELTEDLKKYNLKINNLKNNEEHIETLRVKIDEHNLAIKFKEKIDKINNLKKQIDKYKLEINSETISIDSLKDEINKINFDKEDLDKKVNRINQEYKNNQYDYDQLDFLRKSIEIGTILEFKIDNLNTRKKDFEKEISELNIKKDELNLLTIKLEEHTKNINQLGIIDENIIYKLKENIILLNNKIEKNKENIEKIKDLNSDIFQLNNNKNILTANLSKINEEIELINKNTKDNFIGVLAKELKEDSPCPLCGSKHHPNKAKEVIKEENLSIIKLQEDKLEIENNLNNLNNKLFINKNTIDQIGEVFIQEELEKEKSLTQKNLNELETHNLQIKTKKEYLNEEIIKYTQNISNLKKLIEDKTINSNLFLEEIEILDKDIKNIQLENKIHNNFNIKTLIEEKNILEEKEKKQRAIFIEKNKLEKILADIKTTKLELINKIKLHEQSINQKSISLDLVLKDSEKEEEEIINEARENGFENIDNISKKIIENKAQYEGLLEEIKVFNEDSIKYSSLLNECLKRIDNKVYNEEIYINLKLMNTKMKFDEETLYENITSLKTKISILEKSINEVKEILEKKESLEKELDNILILRETFKGKKFVKFLARKKLDYVVYQASKRLRKITHGRYSLGVNNNCDFNIIDAFNNNSIRDSSTLSGGETFIVSLVLALALSSQLQLKGDINLEFFFLDEGFGTLDSELLDRVISTLEDIKNREKISIGIISHVEDLKIRIPRRLEVSSAIPGERGSIIKLI